MHGETLAWILVILVNHRLAGQLRYTHDAVGIVHTVLLDSIYGRVHLTTATVEIGSMYMDAQWLATHSLGMNTSRECQPVVGVDNIKFFATGNYSGNDTVVVDLVVEIRWINAVYPLKQEWQDIPRPDHKGKEKVVTFLGRLTMQKGPEYFVEAANMVLHRTRNVRFCMAGSGDMMDQMIYLAAERGIADRFHFPGFMRGKQVYECLKDSDVYVMPSVSEPFGISPLEAMQCGTPTIISKQSGCGEILTNCIKVDYWDIHALADAIYSICHNESLFDYLSEEGKKEVDQITWEKVGARIKDLYLKTLGWK